MYKGEKGLVSPSFVSLEADQASGSALREELGKKDLAFFSSNIELGVRPPLLTSPPSLSSPVSSPLYSSSVLSHHQTLRHPD